MAIVRGLTCPQTHIHFQFSKQQITLQNSIQIIFHTQIRAKSEFQIIIKSINTVKLFFH